MRIEDLHPKVLFKRLARRKIEGELVQIDGLARRVPGVTNHIKIADRRVSFVDGQSFEQQYRHIIERGIYDFVPTSSRPCMIDAGANIGIGALRFIEKFPYGKLIAFEPDPQVFAVLEKNLEGISKEKVILENCALWREKGVVSFYEEHADSGSLVCASDRVPITVKAHRLSDYLDEAIDFLKIDIEGAELEVLKESKSKLSNVRNIFVEHHSFVGKDQDLDELLSLLSEAGFRYNIETSVRRSPYFYTPKVYCGMDGFVHVYGYR